MSENKKLKIFIPIIFTGIFFCVLSVFAKDAAGLINPLGTTSIPELVGRIIKAILGIVGSIALLMFIYGGFMWMTSGGSPKKVEKGQQTLIWATIGLATIFFAYAAVGFVIKSITGSVEERGPSAEEITGFCLCKEGKAMVLPLREVFVSQDDCVKRPEKGQYDCQWVYGACKNEKGDYNLRLDKAECETAGWTWAGSK